MKYSNDKKQAIILYLLEKIESGAQGISKIVAETFNISTNTVHNYLNELVENKTIEKLKRGEYKLANIYHEYEFKRSSGDLERDTLPYDAYLKKLVSHLGENVQRIWSYGLSEMVNNVIDHSDAETMQMIIVRTI